MEIKRTTEIFIETSRRVVINPENSAQGCALCGEPVLAAETAAALLNLKSRFVYQIVESGAVHFAEAATGATLVCLSSLTTVLESGVKQSPGAAIV